MSDTDPMNHTDPRPGSTSTADHLTALADLTERIGNCGDLDDILTTSLESMSTEFHFRHSMIMMLDEMGTSLYTIASHGYDRSGIGSEILVGVDIIGAVASQRRPMRVGNLGLMINYGRAIRDSSDPDAATTEIALPGLPTVASQMAAPVVAANQLLGVVAVESEQLGAFTEADESVLAVVGRMLASAIVLTRLEGSPTTPPPTPQDRDEGSVGIAERASTATFRYFPTDGSTFVDGEYLIKGVAGRILWRLLSDCQESGRTEFTNREVRLDRSLELPAYRDNLESRLVLLQRRLDERQAPVRISKTGRGQFHLEARVALRLELMEQPD